MTRGSVRVLVCFILMAVFASACGRERSPAATPPAASSGTAPATVDVARVASTMLDASLPLPGELQPYETVPMFPRVSGFVKSIDVDRGSRVKQGQVIIRLEAPELLAQRAEAQAKLQGVQAQLAAVEAKLAADESTYQRLRAASATPGVVAGNDLDVSQKAADAGRAQVKAQQDAVTAGMQAAQALVEMADYLEVKAPFDGVVTERNVHPGALVGPNGATPMVRIERMSRLRLVVPVPESYVAGVRSGRAVEFAVAAYPGRTFTGAVARSARAVEVKTRTMPVELDVANLEGDLSPGTFAEVRWPVARREPSLFVPPSSVTSTLERTFVVRIRDGKTEWVDVKTGVTADKVVEVFGDLRAGDQVAVRGTDELRPSMTVTPRAPSTP